MKKIIMMTGVLGMLIVSMTGCGAADDTEKNGNDNAGTNVETSVDSEDSDQVVTKEIDEDNPPAQSVVGSDTIDLGN